MIYKLAFVFLFALNLGAKSYIPLSFKANFTETSQSFISKKSKITSGIIAYKTPGFLKYQKKNIILASSAKGTVVYNPPYMPGVKGDVTITKSRFVFEKLLNALKNGLVNNQYYTVKLKKKECDLVFTNKMQEELSLKSVRLTFKDRKSQEFKNIKSLRLDYLHKPSSTLEFKNLQANVQLPKSYFEVKYPPKTTNITRN